MHNSEVQIGTSGQILWRKTYRRSNAASPVVKLPIKPEVAIFILVLLAFRAATQNSCHRSETQVVHKVSSDQSVPADQGAIGMFTKGLSLELVAAKVRNSKCHCETSPAALELLKAATVHDRIILAIVQSTAPAPQQPSGLTDVHDAKTVYLVIGTTGLSVFDQIGANLQRWKR